LYFFGIYSRFNNFKPLYKTAQKVLKRFDKHLNLVGGAFIEPAQTVLRRFIKAAQKV
jgi:hypothetical protein